MKILANNFNKEQVMNLQLTGHHLEITPAMREYVQSKLIRIRNHFDHVIDVKVTMSVEKLAQKVEATLHVPGNDLHAECIDENMYSAIDMLTDKLNRQVLKHKEKQGSHHKTNGAVKHQNIEQHQNIDPQQSIEQPSIN
jgi:putative sigma-54 modulation protein